MNYSSVFIFLLLFFVQDLFASEDFFDFKSSNITKLREELQIQDEKTEVYCILKCAVNDCLVLTPQELKFRLSDAQLKSIVNQAPIFHLSRI